jgi:hypothetical protein
MLMLMVQVEPKRLHDVCLFDSGATVKQSGKRFSAHVVKEESNVIAIGSDQTLGHSGKRIAIVCYRHLQDMP